MKEIYSPAVEQKYDLFLSGDNEKSTHYISAGYLKEDGIRRNNWFERYTLRVNSEHKLNNKLTVGEYLYIDKTKNRPTGDGSGLPYRSIPLMDIYDATRAGGWAAVPVGFQGSNAVGDAENRVYNNNNWGMEGNFFADWKIIKGLDLRATAGRYMGGKDNSQFNLLYDYGILKNDIRKLEKELSRDQTLHTNIVLTYNKSFGKHDIKAMAGWEAIKSTNTNVKASTEGFPVDYMPDFSTSTQSSSSRFAEAGYGKTSQLAQFGRLNYNFGGRYLLQATVRRDGANKFIGDYQYGVFPSVSKEKFLAAIKQEPLHAHSYFWLARAYDALNDSITALKNYSMATDLDYNPFRAISDFNQIVKKIAVQHHDAYLFDADSLFKANATRGIPGFDLFLDYMHPTRFGNILLAVNLGKYIRQKNLFNIKRPSVLMGEKKFEALLSDYCDEKDVKIQITRFSLFCLTHQYISSLNLGKWILSVLPESYLNDSSKQHELHKLKDGIEAFSMFCAADENVLSGRDNTEEMLHAKTMIKKFYEKYYPYGSY